MDPAEVNSITVTSPEQLEALIPMLKNHIPSSLVVISGLKRVLQYPDLNYKTVCFYGQKDKNHPDGIMIIHILKEEIVNGVVWLSDQRLDVLEQGLKKIEFWNKLNIRLHGVHTNVLPCLRRAIYERGGQHSLLFQGICYWLPLDKALNMDITCPAGTYLKRLSVDDSRLVHNYWHASNYSLEETADEIRQFPSVGLYREEDDQLISWMTTRYFGYLSRLHTRQEFRGRGYAKIVVRFLAKQLAQNGHDPYAFVGLNNPTSQKCFTELGFQPQYIGNVVDCIQASQ